MSDVVSSIAVPESSLSSPKGLIRGFISRFKFGTRFAIGLMVFFLAVGAVVMIGKRLNLPVGKLEQIAG